MNVKLTTSPILRSVCVYVCVCVIWITITSMHTNRHDLTVLYVLAQAMLPYTQLYQAHGKTLREKNADSCTRIAKTLWWYLAKPFHNTGSLLLGQCGESCVTALAIPFAKDWKFSLVLTGIWSVLSHFVPVNVWEGKVYIDISEDELPSSLDAQKRGQESKLAFLPLSDT